MILDESKRNREIVPFEFRLVYVFLFFRASFTVLFIKKDLIEPESMKNF
jgi:hypothetical protein